ncbi:MAG: NAD(P)-dependent alcohol dehydrogenase [Phycisphaerales bacterium]|nr:NAD(P)-dependent alcohol dehydrogenase [Phycisphaerales bacterium]
MRLYRLPTATKIDDLTFTDAPSPAPGHGQVAVRVRAVSLNYRDLMIATGTYGAKPPRAGLVPCSDGAGEVIAVGDGVSRVKVGDRVAGIFHQKWLGGPFSEAVPASALGGDLDGVLAEEVVLDVDGVVKVPDGLSFEEAATLPCAGVTAWSALFEGPRPVKAGDTVLTLGTGGVSVFAIQFAKAVGARVVSTSSSDEKLGRAKALGTTDGINYKDTPEWGKEVMRVTGGVGADVVVEIGGGSTMGHSITAVRKGGTVAVIGVLTGGEIDPRRLISRAVTLRGVYVGSRDAFEAMNRAIAVNGIKPVIDRVFPFEQAREAYRHLQSGSHFGKVVIRVG